jgi:hypothetical protein
MGWMIWGSNPGRNKRFSLLHNIHTSSGTYPAFCSRSSEVKNKWRCTSTPLICLHGIDKENVLLFAGVSAKQCLVYQCIHLTAVVGD